MSGTADPSGLIRGLIAFALVLFILAPPAHAQSEREEQRPRFGPGTGNPDEHLVPWTFLGKGESIGKGPIVVYWLPSTADEMKRSQLLTSRPLLEDSTRCVRLQVVLPADVTNVEKLGATGKLPAAVLVDREGKVVRRVDNVRGALPTAAVEQMVSDELSSRDRAVFPEITEARKRAAAGDKDGAIDLYKKVWDDRCLFPLIGAEARRALKGLGVIVREDPTPPPADPNLRVINPTSTAPPAEHKHDR
jgi:hypothetical protein